MKFTTALSALALVACASAQTIVEVAQSTGAHETLVTLVVQANLAETVGGPGPLTVFAPTDAAFDALPASAAKYTTPEWSDHLVDILTYHVVSGKVMSTDLVLDANVTMVNKGTTTITSLDPAMINSATITPADVEASNGVVHVVDEVLLPTSVTKNIVEIASGAEDFSTLVSLVVAADLAETLSGEGPFTVFAPTNAAFAGLEEAVVTYLGSPEGKDDLAKILTYHVFPGVVYQSAVPTAEVKMVSGDSASVTADPAKIDNANILPGQVLASNGVIHAIDAVILPSSLVLPDLSAAAPAPAPAPTDDSAAVSMGSVFALASAAVAMLF